MSVPCNFFYFVNINFKEDDISHHLLRKFLQLWSAKNINKTNLLATLCNKTFIMDNTNLRNHFAWSAPRGIKIHNNELSTSFL